MVDPPRATGTWVLPRVPKNGNYERIHRANVEWWRANLDSVVFIAFAILVAVVAPSSTKGLMDLLAWWAGAVLAIIWSLRLARTGVGLGRDGIRLYRWWGSTDLEWRNIIRFGLSSIGGRFPRELLTIHTTDGRSRTVDRINVPRWLGSSFRDEQARAAAASVPRLVDELNALLQEHRT